MRRGRYPVLRLLPEVDEHDPVWCFTEPFDVSLPVIFTAKHGRWSAHLFLLAPWRRARGGWPRDWHRRPDVFPGPIMRYWTLGPLQIRHLPTYPRGDA